MLESGSHDGDLREHRGWCGACDSGVVLATFIDVAGAEEQAIGTSKKRGTSAEIAVENGKFRKLFMEVVDNSAKRGFLSRKMVCELKGSSPLNFEGAKFVPWVKSQPAIRVLLFVDWFRPDLFGRAVTLGREFLEVAAV